MRSHLPRFISDVIFSADAGRLYGPALDTVTAVSTAIGATLAAAAAATGDSFQIRNTGNAQQPAWLLQLHADLQVTGSVRVRSPKMHDNVDALRTRIQAGDLSPQLPWGVPQPVYGQDVLTVEHAGSAVAGDIESSVLTMYYPDLPGTDARLFTWDAIKGRGPKNILGVRLAITLGSAAGYNGSRALNADVDLLKANTYYALLGISTDVEAAAICLKGPDTGNLRVNVPGEPSLIHHTNYYFKRLAIGYGLPVIPVINSANKGATFIDAVNDENGGTANVVVWLQELSQ
jgi:hypothetical protein